MALPAKSDRGVLLVFMNGVKLSVIDDFAIEGRFLSVGFRIEKGDRLSMVAMSPVEATEFEVVLPYRYDAWTWFDPSDPHDPKVKQIDAPQARVTQL